MRERLYHGKSIHTREWVEGDLLTHGVDYETAILVHNANELGGSAVISVIPETVGEWTGHNDLTGEKLFEGAIVKLSGEGEEEYFEVVWDNDTARFEFEGDGWCCGFDNYYNRDIEIIGNIYDNPELLEGA